MATYIWQDAGDASGEITSETAAMAKAVLRRKGIEPVRVRRKRKVLPLFSLQKGGRPNAKDIAAFTRQVATMVQAGVPLVRSFEIIAEGFEKPRMQELVLAVRDGVAGGDSFASVLARHPRHFDSLYCSLVDAGEQAGSLDSMLGQIAGYQAKAQALKAKVKKAMTYPTAVILVAIIVTAILLIEVVPRFEDVFASFDAELPAFTRWTISLSRWVQAAWLPGLIALGGGAALLRLAVGRSALLRRALDILILKMPIAGGIIKMSILARYGRTLATTFAAGVPLIEALGSVAAATGNRLFEEAIMNIRDEVTTGQSLHLAMNESRRFPGMMVQMVMIGEEAGALDDMLAKSATYYEEQVDNQVDNLTALMEPLIMSVLGVLIGGLIIAMYLPIFQLGAVVGG